MPAPPSRTQAGVALQARLSLVENNRTLPEGPQRTSPTRRPSQGPSTPLSSGHNGHSGHDGNNGHGRDDGNGQRPRLSRLGPVDVDSEDLLGVRPFGSQHHNEQSPVGSRRGSMASSLVSGETEENPMSSQSFASDGGRSAEPPPSEGGSSSSSSGMRPRFSMYPKPGANDSPNISDGMPRPLPPGWGPPQDMRNFSIAEEDESTEDSYTNPRRRSRWATQGASYGHVLPRPLPENLTSNVRDYDPDRSLIPPPPDDDEAEAAQLPDLEAHEVEVKPVVEEAPYKAVAMKLREMQEEESEHSSGESDPEEEDERRAKKGSPRYRKHSGKGPKNRVLRAFHNLWLFRMRFKQTGISRYVCQFFYGVILLIYFFVFVLFLTWVSHGPVPPYKWDRVENLTYFPQNDQVHLNRLASGLFFEDAQLQMTDVPWRQTSCLSCGGGEEDVSFPVELRLESPSLKLDRLEGGFDAQTLHPVLLASVTFNEWWIAADRNDSHPQYFQAHTRADGSQYRYTTPTCNLPPVLTTTTTTTTVRVARVGFSMLVRHLDWSELTSELAEGERVAGFRQAVQRAVADEAGGDVEPENVALSLFPGSVMVEVHIELPPNVDPSETEASLTASWQRPAPADSVYCDYHLGHMVAWHLRFVDSLFHIASGTMAVEQIEAPALLQLPTTATTTLGALPREPAVRIDTESRFNTEGTFVLACVVWSSAKLAWHQAHDSTVMTREDLHHACDSLGGVGGRPCSGIEGLEYDVSASGEEVFVDGGGLRTILRMPGGNFSGTIELRTCITPGRQTDPECAKEKRPMHMWPCHKCVVNTSNLLPGTGDLLSFDSISPFEVTVQNLPPDSWIEIVPRAYILTAPLGDELQQDLNSEWTYLYEDHEPHPPVWLRVWEDWMGVVQNPTIFQTVGANAVMHPLDNRMSGVELHKVDMHPVECMARRGPLYLVACIVNESTYANDEFKQWQDIRGPPFNDRCLAIAGRCAHVCSNEESTEGIAHCTPDGKIPLSALVYELEAPKNSALILKVMLVTMIAALAVKLLTYCPGMFTPFKHAMEFDRRMTGYFQYICICIPSGGEAKCTVLRNMIGAVACAPPWCLCPFHVVLVDEGHRPHMKELWDCFRDVIEVLYGTDTVFACNFMAEWVNDTNTMELKQLEANEVLDNPEKNQYVLSRISGTVTLEKLKKQQAEKVDKKRKEKYTKLWSDPYEKTKQKFALDNSFEQNLQDKIDALRECCKNNQKKQVTHVPHLDEVAWWPKGEHPHPHSEHKKRDSHLLRRCLRLHYLARGRPQEDARTMKVAGVRRGMWCYKVKEDDDMDNWLEKRKDAFMYVGEAGANDQDIYVPLRTSRGKAGGLNFAENYLHWYVRKLKKRPEDHEGSRGMSHRDAESSAVRLFSICDARHQYQTDFMCATIPYFFKKQKKGNDELYLDEDVAFTQTPQYFPELKDASDYLDNNNAQFFRLNCMIRNCCGGVSSCGTNGTWMLPLRSFSGTFWNEPEFGVLYRGPRDERVLVEHMTFHEGCKVEDTASSLERVKEGKRSQYVNRRLSYGMAKNPQDYLAAVQRWAEGGVVLSLQTFMHPFEGHHSYMLWTTFGLYVLFVFSLLFMVFTDAAVRLGFMQEMIPTLTPLVHLMTSIADIPIPTMVEDYAGIALYVMSYFVTLFSTLVCIGIGTKLLKCFSKKWRTALPDSFRWWGRLCISLDNLTYFIWCWTCFVWIIFNSLCVFQLQTYALDAQVMLSFSVVLQVLAWSIIITAVFRAGFQSSHEANEVSSVCMDNIWRSTQLFYMGAPLLVYSIIMGVRDYTKWRNFKMDISFWEGGDRGVTAKNIVKYWTLFLICLAIASWIYFLTSPDAGNGETAASGLMILTFVALDVLPPCTYLWLGDAKDDYQKWAAAYKARAKANMEQAEQVAVSSGVKVTATAKSFQQRVRWRDRLTAPVWWRCVVHQAILNGFVTGLFKWLGPAQQVLMPCLMLMMPSLGLNSSFMLLISSHQ